MLIQDLEYVKNLKQQIKDAEEVIKDLESKFRALGNFDLSHVSIAYWGKYSK